MNMKATNQTYYEVLEVAPSTPHHEIVAAYQRAKEAYAPDSVALYSMFSVDEATELRNLVEEAFLTLGNPAKRKEYDATLLGKTVNSMDMLPDFEPMQEFKPKKPNPTGSSVSHNQSNYNSPIQNNEGVRQASIPDGFAKSRISVYEINKNLEEEIKNQTAYDGAFLRKIRQYKNINIDQMSKETRISRSYLAAIEAEDFDALPAPVFLRGFVVQYARILGLNENLVASSYMSRVKKG